MMEQGRGILGFHTSICFRKDGEAGVRMQDQDDKEKAATSRPEPKPGRQHVQRLCDKNELSRSVEQTEASAARRPGQTRDEQKEVRRVDESG